MMLLALESRTIYLVILCESFAILYAPQIIAGPPTSLKCNGPTDHVKVTVKQGSQSTTYSYTVVNLSKSPIYSFSLGDSDQQEMKISAANVPKSVSSPLSWTGEHYFGHESEYMSIEWSTDQPDKNIFPNQSLSGFVIETIKPWNPINKFPFTVMIGGGDCFWGRVTIE